MATVTAVRTRWTQKINDAKIALSVADRPIHPPLRDSVWTPSSHVRKLFDALRQSPKSADAVITWGLDLEIGQQEEADYTSTPSVSSALHELEPIATSYTIELPGESQITGLSELPEECSSQGAQQE